MPTDFFPPVEMANLIPEPLSNYPHARRRFCAFLQKWRIWLCNQIGRSQPANKALVDRGVDDLLALALLVQFVRDRVPNAIHGLDQLPHYQGTFTLGQMCEDLQIATSCQVLKTVFDPAGFAHSCTLPVSVIECAFWRPVIQASRRLYGPCLPITIFGDLHQWRLAFSSDETPGHKRGARSKTRRYDKGIHYTPAALVNYLTVRVLSQAFDGLSPDQILRQRILDPSCGCGVFLIAALRFIFAWLVKTRLSADAPSELSLNERLGSVDDQIRFSRMNPRARWIIPRNVCFSFS